MKTIVLIPVTAVAFLVSEVTADNSALNVQERPEGFLITEGPSKVLFYQRKPKDLGGRFRRANYVHPLYDLDGNVLTEDFPEDHPHHRGIFWAWHQTLLADKKLGDGWATQDYSWEVTDAKVSRDDERWVALQVQVSWTSPHWLDPGGERKPFVRETTTIRVHRTTNDVRKIDFEIRLQALEHGLRIGGADNEKGYGGFSLRVRLPEDVRFTGSDGDVAPRRVPVETGPWLDISGHLGESAQPNGIVVLGHPSNPKHPHPWILRRKGSMQNAAYPGREPVALSNQHPLSLRYRLVLHRGAVDLAKITTWQREYADVP